MSADIVALHAGDKKRAQDSAPSPAYAELAVTTNFSFLRGASDPEELIERAQQLVVGHRLLGRLVRVARRRGRRWLVVARLVTRLGGFRRLGLVLLGVGRLLVRVGDRAAQV